MESPPPQGDGRATQGNSLRRSSLNCGTRIRVTKLTFFNICRHHPTFKFKPHATDDERYVWGIDGVGLPLRSCAILRIFIYMGIYFSKDDTKT